MRFSSVCATFLLSLSAALAEHHVEKRDACDSIAPYLSSFSSYPTARVTSFCSSLLHYPSVHATTTRTITRTIKTTITQTTRTRSTVTTTETRPTVTITDVVYVRKTTTTRIPYTTVAKDKRQGPPPLRVQDGKVLGKPLSVASQACSCLVEKPTSTVTVRTTTTSTITTKVTRTRTITTTEVSVPITTITRTRIIRNTATECIGSNPSPSFKMQFKDTGATDQYNNQWVSYAPYPPGDDFTGEEITSSPSRAGGGVFYFDCIGRLTTQGSFGVPEYFAAIASGDIATVYLFNQTEYLGYDPSSIDYLDCGQAGGFLDCTAAGPTGPYTILQTSDLFDLLGTFVVIGQSAGPEDSYFPFRWKFVNV